MKYAIYPNILEQNTHQTLPAKTERTLRNIAAKSIRKYRREYPDSKRYELIRVMYRMKVCQRFSTESYTFMKVAYDILDKLLNDKPRTITRLSELVPSQS